MSRADAIRYFEAELGRKRRQIVEWAMSGWSDIANTYRREARDLQRRIARLHDMKGQVAS